MANVKYVIFLFLLQEIFAASLYQNGHPLSGFFINQGQPSNQWLNPFFQTQHNGLQNRQFDNIFNDNSFFQQIPLENIFNQQTYSKKNTQSSNFDEKNQQTQPSSSQYQQESKPYEVQPQFENFDLSNLFNIEKNNQSQYEPSHESELPPHLLAQHKSNSSGMNTQQHKNHPQTSQKNTINLNQENSPLEFMMQMPFMNTELPDDTNQKNMYKNEKQSSPPRMNQRINLPKEINSDRLEKQMNRSVDETQYNINKDDIMSFLSKILGSEDTTESKTTQTEPIQITNYKQNDQISERKLSETNYDYNVNKNTADKHDFNAKMDLMNNDTSSKDILSLLSNILGSRDMSSQLPFIMNNRQEEKKVQQNSQHETLIKPLKSIKEQAELQEGEKKESKALQTESTQTYKQPDQIPDGKLYKETVNQQNNYQLKQNDYDNLNQNTVNKNDVNTLMNLINKSPNSEDIMSLLSKVLGSGDMSSQLPFMMKNFQEKNIQHNSPQKTKALEKPSSSPKSFKATGDQIQLKDSEPKVFKLYTPSKNNLNKNINLKNDVDRQETQIEKPPTAASDVVQSPPASNPTNKIAVQKVLSEISETVKLNLKGVKAIYEFVSSSFTNSNINEKLRLTLDISEAIVRGFQNTLELNKKSLLEKQEKPKYNTKMFDDMNMPNFFPKDFENDFQMFDNLVDTMRSLGMPNFMENLKSNQRHSLDAAQFEALLNNSFGDFFNNFGFDTIGDKKNNFSEQNSNNEYNIPEPIFKEVTKVLFENPPTPYKDNSQKIKKNVPELITVIRETFQKEIDDINHGKQPNVFSD